MKTEITVHVRAYTVRIKDERTGEKLEDTIVLERGMFRAGGRIGLNDTEILNRIYNRRGFRVSEICNVVKASIPMDLGAAYATVAGVATAAGGKEGRNV